MEHIEANGLDTVGLYRLSGNAASVQKLRCLVEQGEVGGYFGKGHVRVTWLDAKLYRFVELYKPVFLCMKNSPFILTEAYLYLSPASCFYNEHFWLCGVMTFP